MSRRRNFIPGLNKKQSYIVSTGSAIVLGVVLYFAMRSKSPKIKTVYDWDDTITVMQGAPIQVRLPRGQYQVISPDVLLMSQTDKGTETIVVIMTRPVADQMYSIDTLLVDQATNKTFPIHLEAWPSSAFERNRAPTMREILYKRRFWQAAPPPRTRRASSPRLAHRGVTTWADQIKM